MKLTYLVCATILGLAMAVPAAEGTDNVGEPVVVEGLKVRWFFAQGKDMLLLIRARFVQYARCGDRCSNDRDCRDRDSRRCRYCHRRRGEVRYLGLLDVQYMTVANSTSAGALVGRIITVDGVIESKETIGG